MAWTPDNIDEVTRMGDLYDFYGALLTERQREILEMYHVEDFSLSEIAENLSISRQAVHDQVKRASDQLELYESVLRLRAMSLSQRATFDQLQVVWDDVSSQVPAEIQHKMNEALDAVAHSLTGPLGGEPDA